MDVITLIMKIKLIFFNFKLKVIVTTMNYF